MYLMMLIFEDGFPTLVILNIKLTINPFLSNKKSLFHEGILTDAINELGSGWKDFFSSIDSIGNIASGIGQGVGAMKTP